MTTYALIVVIIILTCNLAILYLPFNKQKKAVLSSVTVGFLVVACLAQNAWNNEVPVLVREKIVNADNPAAQRAMMTTFNISEEKLNTETTTPTPIELGVAVMLVLALVFTPLLTYVVRDCDNLTAKKVQQIAFSLSAVACALVLSLYYGLELMLVPWYKKRRKKGNLNRC